MMCYNSAKIINQKQNDIPERNEKINEISTDVWKFLCWKNDGWTGAGKDNRSEAVSQSYDNRTRIGDIRRFQC